MWLSDAAARDVHDCGFAPPLFNALGQVTGEWQPDGRDADPLTLAPTDYEAPPRTAMLGAFSGMDGHGDWVPHIEDESSGMEGRLRSWCLEITLVPEPEVTGLAGAMGVLVAVLQRRRRGGCCGVRRR
jgi:hypothetical protein